MRNQGRVFLGDWVRTQYGRVGRVHAKHHWCPENDDWIAMQRIPVTDAQRKAPWCSLLVHGGGSMVQPIDTLELIDDPPESLDNPWSEYYFREVVNACRVCVSGRAARAVPAGPERRADPLLAGQEWLAGRACAGWCGVGADRGPCQLPDQHACGGMD